MKVEFCKEIEAEVNITAEDIVNELTSRLNDIESALERGESWRYFTSAISTCVLILKKIPSEVISQIPPSTIETIAVHLNEQADRWTELAKTEIAKESEA